MKIKINQFDVNVGEIVLHEPDEQNPILISRNEIPFVSQDQVLDRPVTVFEVIADGYNNAYVAVNIE